MPAAQPGHRSPVRLWLLVLLPALGTILLPIVALTFYAPAPAPVTEAPPPEATPLQREVWARGFGALGTALGGAQAASGRANFVQVSAAHLVTFCSRAAEGAEDDRGFLAFQGEGRQAALEGTSPNFDVLWQRLCAAPLPGW